MPMAFETEPFNGDHFIGERIRELVAKHGVRTIVETGTYQGVTTRALARLSEHTVTVEKDHARYAAAHSAMPDVSVYYGDSSQVLPVLLAERHRFQPYLERPPVRFPALFYLDAHWGADWPLLGELAAIAEAGIKPVIVIHDFEVPGTDLGFDEYAGQHLDWDYVRKAVERIYGADGYVKSTNDPERAAGARRGVLYLEPKV